MNSRHRENLALGGAILNGLTSSIPILPGTRPIRLSCHDTCHRVGEPLVYRAMRLLAGAHALGPIRHMSQRNVTNAHGWKLGFAEQKNVFRDSLFVDVWVVLVISLLFDHAIPRAAVASKVDERCTFAHITCKGGRIVTKAGRIADQKTLGIFQ